MNKVILKGRLARDVDLRTTTTGKSVAQVSIAVNRRGKDQGADFIPLVIWGQQAEVFHRYLGKGREVLVEGRMQTRSYDDKTGNKRYVTEVIVENFDFCGSRSDAAGNGGHGGFDGGSQGGFGGGSSYGGGYSSGAPAQGNGGTTPFGTADGLGADVSDEDIPF